jgi:hypothetical protein
VSSVANLQIKGIDDDLYREIRKMAKDENRSVCKQILYITKLFLTKRKAVEQVKTPAEILLELAGSWDDERPAVKIIAEIKGTRRTTVRL